ncbi:MAG: DNA repair protein RadA [Firmicutes bacterium]|nr:DNA repair protein RadA [Bacillota bacterium]
MPNKKKTTAFFCSECGYESAKWTGQCPSCHAWNTMVEAPVRIQTGGTASAVSRGGAGAVRGTSFAAGSRPVPLSAVHDEGETRWTTGYGELDRVLGGGIVKGSMLLVGGDPGIGKSTLLLQVTRNLAADGRNVLYISGEESLHQIKLRAARIGHVPDNLRFLCETDLDTITEILLEEKPELCVIDSIQTMYNASVAAAAGSISQVRETTGVLLRLAKETGITFFIIGHVTKEGTVAGPRVLEHMVDTVLYFEGDRYASYRIIRGVKNRFGSTNEIGVFEMRREGLCEVENPSEYMLSGRPENASGSVVSCAMDGTRAILTEVQALVCKSNFGFPKRQATGTDYNRVSLLMAVLEKRIGIPLSEYDAYVNLAGGIRQSEPAMDLGIAMALLSSFRGKPVGDRTVAFGEIGLSGEVRMVTMADVRVQEAAKLGFTTCILPKSNLKGLKAPDGIEIVGISNLKEAADLIGQR